MDLVNLWKTAFKAKFDKYSRNNQAEAKSCVSYKKNVTCDTDQSQLNEITFFLV